MIPFLLGHQYDHRPNLKGTDGQWTGDQLEQQVKSGQLVRGNSAWGSPPFPTKDFPGHKKARKRRLVVDYRRVNLRTMRAIYYVRRASDILLEAMVQYGIPCWTLLRVSIR